MEEDGSVLGGWAGRTFAVLKEHRLCYFDLSGHDNDGGVTPGSYLPEEVHTTKQLYVLWGLRSFLPRYPVFEKSHPAFTPQ